MSKSLSLKDNLFVKFQKEYGGRLEKLRPIFQYLYTYPDVLLSLKISTLIAPEKIYECQKEWVWNISKYEGLEQEHFKPYWVPIESENYDYFIDLSNEAFPVFINSYFMEEPFCYFKTIIFKSAYDFLMAIETKTDFIALENEVQKRIWNTFSLKMQERKKLMFEGKLNLEKPDYYSIFEDKVSLPLNCSYSDGYFTIKCIEVSAIICGILPYSQPINLIESTFDNVDISFLAGYDLSIIRNICSLTYSIRI